MALAAAYILGHASRSAQPIRERDPRREDRGADRLTSTVESEIDQLGEAWGRFTPELEYLYDVDRLERRRKHVRFILRAAMGLVAFIAVLHSAFIAAALRPMDALHVLLSACLFLLCHRAVGLAGSAAKIDRTVMVAVTVHLALTAMVTVLDQRLGQTGFVAARPLELMLFLAGCALLCLPQRPAVLTLAVAFGLAAVSIVSAAGLAGMGGPIVLGLSIVSLISFSANRLMDEAARESFLMRLRADLQLRRSEADRRAMERLASLDPLTGIPNRRAFDMELARTLARSGADGHVLLALIDVDHFKSYNDVGGHALGDECLRRVAASLRSGIGTGFLARYGGEEFAAILQGGSAEELEAGADRLRQAVRDLRTPHPGRTDGTAHVTVSIGAGHHAPGEPGQVLMERVDRSLYRAKALGRDRLVVAGDAASDAADRLRALREAMPVSIVAGGSPPKRSRSGS